MLVGVGIDSVLLSRISDKLSETFVRRFLKKQEQVYYDQLRDWHLKVDYVAKLWAIKEACVKAWPRPSCIFSFTIKRNPTNYELVSPDQYHCKISVTNDKETIVAICVLENKG